MTNLPAISAASYVAWGAPYFYPGLGDQQPPRGADVLLLTKGGICIRGPWKNDGSVIGWAPFPKRDHEREKQILMNRTTKESTKSIV